MFFLSSSRYHLLYLYYYIITLLCHWSRCTNHCYKCCFADSPDLTAMSIFLDWTKMLYVKVSHHTDTRAHTPCAVQHCSNMKPVMSWPLPISRAGLELEHVQYKCRHGWIKSTICSVRGHCQVLWSKDSSVFHQFWQHCPLAKILAIFCGPITLPLAHARGVICMSCIQLFNWTSQALQRNASLHQCQRKP